MIAPSGLISRLATTKEMNKLTQDKRADSLLAIRKIVEDLKSLLPWLVWLAISSMNDAGGLKSSSLAQGTDVVTHMIMKALTIRKIWVRKKSMMFSNFYKSKH